MEVSCLIEFDSNPTGVYFSGQNINGNITLKAPKVKTTEGVVLKVIGRCQTNWADIMRTHSNSNSPVYRGHEEFFLYESKLIMPPPGETQIDIATGTYTFPFFCTLPPHCPSSFEKISLGHIRYHVVVTLKRTWKFNQTYSKGFTVVKTLNIMDPLFQGPFTKEEEKHYGWGPFKSDPLTMQVTLAGSAFVPGQSIPVSILIDNQTDIDVKEVILQLWLKVIYHANFTVSTKSDFVVISTFTGDPVIRYTKKLFNYCLPVPPTPPSDSTHSRLINLSYEVRVNSITKGAHLAKSITVPITIGSILTSARTFLENYEQSLRESDPSDSANVPTMFQEADYMPAATLSSRNEYGEKSYKPKYPMYDSPIPSAEIQRSKC